MNTSGKEHHGFDVKELKAAKGEFSFRSNGTLVGPSNEVTGSQTSTYTNLAFHFGTGGLNAFIALSIKRDLPDGSYGLPSRDLSAFYQDPASQQEWYADEGLVTFFRRGNDVIEGTFKFENYRLGTSRITEGRFSVEILP